MLVALGRLHGLLFKLVVWLVMLPLRSLWSLLGAILALLGEEFRRWLGILVIGLMVAAVSWVTLKVAAQQRVALLLVLLMGMLWLCGVFKAAHLTMENRLWKVRQRQMFRELSGQVSQLPQQIETLRGEAARRTRGTPAGRVFKANRETDRQEAADARAAAEQAAAERAEAERLGRAAARAKAARDRELERIGAEHDPFVKQGGGA